MFFLCTPIIILFTTLLGCSSDPILDKATKIKEESVKNLQSSSSSPKPGTPKEPKPVQVKPKPGTPKEPKPVQVKPKPVKPKEGKPEKESKPKVTLSGRVEILGDGDWKGKPIRIDVFDGDQQAIDGPRPKVVSTKRIKQQGDFTLSVQQKDQSLWLGAYCDVDGDGRPGPNDPSGWFSQNPISAAKDSNEIVIQLAIPVEENAPKEEKKQ